MATARTATRPGRAQRSSRSRPGQPRRRRPPAARISWDRIARVALLLTLGGVLLLYVGPLKSYLATWQDAKTKRVTVARLRADNLRLEARRRALQSPVVLEREARRLGMIRPDERSYVIRGLPNGR